MSERKWGGCNTGSGAVYGLGLIGALVYYLQQASGATEVIMAIIKSLFWPGFLVYEALKSFGLQP